MILLEQRLRDMQDANSNATRLDALLSLSRINWRYVPDAEPRDSKETSDWQSDRKGRGWIVPMPVGYGALSEVYSPGEVLNARDSKTPFRFPSKACIRWANGGVCIDCRPPSKYFGGLIASLRLAHIVVGMLGCLPAHCLKLHFLE